MNINIKKIIIVVSGILLLAIIINYSAGTTIVINGKNVTGIGRYMAAYLALVIFAALLVIIIPSTLILISVLLIVFGLFFLFFPLLPVALFLLPGAAVLGIVYLIYKLARKKSRE